MSLFLDSFVYDHAHAVEGGKGYVTHKSKCKGQNSNAATGYRSRSCNHICEKCVYVISRLQSKPVAISKTEGQ